MCGCASHTTRITPGLVSRLVMSIIWSRLGRARLKTVGLPRKPCVLCRIASEFFTRTRSPGHDRGDVGDEHAPGVVEHDLGRPASCPG